MDSSPKKTNDIIIYLNCIMIHGVVLFAVRSILVDLDILEKTAPTNAVLLASKVGLPVETTHIPIAQKSCRLRK
jgi:hypothetical protein